MKSGFGNYVQLGCMESVLGLDLCYEGSDENKHHRTVA
jgi:hypothetical protein